MKEQAQLLWGAEDDGTGNGEDVRGCHNPKGEIADHWDFDEDPNNGNHS